MQAPAGHRSCDQRSIADGMAAEQNYSTPGAVTLRDVVPIIVPAVARTVTVPMERPLATLVLGDAFIIAINGSEVTHCTTLVRSSVVPSLYVPAAVKVTLPPAGIDAICGVTAMLTRAVSVTVKVVDRGPRLTSAPI